MGVCVCVFVCSCTWACACVCTCVWHWSTIAVFNIQAHPIYCWAEKMYSTHVNSFVQTWHLNFWKLHTSSSREYNKNPWLWEISENSDEAGTSAGSHEATGWGITLAGAPEFETALISYILGFLFLIPWLNHYICYILRRNCCWNSNKHDKSDKKPTHVTALNMRWLSKLLLPLDTSVIYQ